MGGNITSKTKYDYTTAANPTGGTKISYSYDDPNWPDLLTKYNDQEIESDAIGNMTFDGTWTYTWQNGRQLAGMTKADTEIEYTYDSDGMRTSKTVNGVTTKYLYYGDQLVGMDTELGTVYFHYDSTGVVAMELGGAVLYYVKNAQGDITALVDTNGYPVVEYTYDAWGNIRSIDGLYATTYGIYNPFRYRGYVYDDETGLYYLQSRYYNPQMGRFINTDDTSVLLVTPTELTDKNLFAYCDNNPVSRADTGGTFWLSVGIGAITGLVGQGICDIISGEFSGFGSYIGATLGGAIGGALGGGLLSKIGSFGADIIGSTASSLFESLFGVACGTNDRTGIEIVLLAIADGVLGGMLPIITGLANNKISEFIQELFDNKFGEFLGETFGDIYEGLPSNVWDVVKESSFTHSPGRSVGCSPGEQYYYNGLLYTCY